jgi:hypothetical protein
VTKGKQAALLVIPVAGVAFGFWALWELVHVLVTWLVMVGFVVAGATALTGGSFALAQRTRRRAGQREMDYARFAAMSHLTEADERWLVSHFWVIPMETLRIRGGKAWDQPWTWAYAETKPLLVKQREQRVLEAEFHRKRVWGENVPVPDEIAREVNEAIEGDVVGVSASPSSCSHFRCRPEGRGLYFCPDCNCEFYTTDSIEKRNK